MACQEDPPAPSPSPSSAERRDRVSRALAALEDAIVAADAAAAEKLAATGDEDARGWARALVDNAAALHVRDLSFRYVDEDLGAADQLAEGEWVGVVEVGWRFDGFDRSPARAEVGLAFAGDGAQALLAGPAPAPEAGSDVRTPPWLGGPLSVHRDRDVLVLVDGSQVELARYVRLARRAVPAVRDVLPDWRRGLVVEVPGSPAELDSALGVPPGEYAAIAAVTSSVDGTHRPDSPVHVFVNPDVLGRLDGRGAQVVMTHEVVHLATGAVRSEAPLWLLEGFADHVALRGLDVPLERAAGQIIAEVRQHGAPERLPGPAEFDTQEGHLGATYEAAWLACRLLARMGGEPALVELYRRASRGEDVDAALRDLFGFGEEEFTRRWRTELETLARTTGR